MKSSTEKSEEKLKSPCVKNCIIDLQTGLCKGCLRSLDEIADWIYLSDDEKKNILNKIETRKENSK